MAAALDEDTAHTLASGRDAIGAMLSTAQRELQKVFMIFVVGFLGTFWALRVWIWEWLRAMTISQMDEEIAAETVIIVTTPFEVILLQAKIGILIGILISIPALVFLSRRELKTRGRWPDIPMSRPRIALLATLSSILFVGGVVYAYRLFFPIMFDFLATQAISVGVAPTYGIVAWTEFLILLTLSFGLAAQLPLAMTALSYVGVVQYETFRDKWKWAVVGIFAFGALFSPPDPFTQIMWAAPLVVLYAFSLALAKIATNISRAGEAGVPVGPGGGLKRGLLKLAGIGLVLLLITAAAIEAGLLYVLYGDLRPFLPTYIQPTEPVGVQVFVDTYGLWGSVLVGLITAAIGLTVAILGYALVVLRRPVHPPLNPSDPSQIDIARLSLEQVRTVPDAVFEAMDEDDAVEYAQAALDDGDPDRAQLIFARFDEVEQDDEDAETTDTEAPGVVEDTATGVVSAFSEDRDKDDIGGYIHDFRFIADTLKSRMLHMFVVFGIVLAGVFTFLYQGGLGYIKEDFITRMPDAVRPEEVSVIALHPVEVLIFIVKVSTLAAVLAVVPMLLYYAWPAMSELGWVAGKRNIILKWCAGTILALAAGTALGYFIIAPAIMSYLVYDALQAGMIISYRINSFAWLIIFTTVGVGLLALIPFTMWMMYLGGMASYPAMRDRWREVTIAAFVFSAMFTPATVLTMFLVGIPVMIFYWVGLAGLWLVTIGGRRGRYGRPDPV